MEYPVAIADISLIASEITFFFLSSQCKKHC